MIILDMNDIILFHFNLILFLFIIIIIIINYILIIHDIMNK